MIEDKWMIGGQTDSQSDRQSGLPLKARLFIFFRGRATHKKPPAPVWGYIYIYIYIWKETQTVTRTNIPTDRHTDRQANTRTEKQADQQTDRHDTHAFQRTHTHTHIRTSMIQTHLLKPISPTHPLKDTVTAFESHRPDPPVEGHVYTNLEGIRHTL